MLELDVTLFTADICKGKLEVIVAVCAAVFLTKDSLGGVVAVSPLRVAWGFRLALAGATGLLGLVLVATLSLPPATLAGSTTFSLDEVRLVLKSPEFKEGRDSTEPREGPLPDKALSSKVSISAFATEFDRECIPLVC